MMKLVHGVLKPSALSWDVGSRWVPLSVALLVSLVLPVASPVTAWSAESDVVVESWQADSGLPHNFITAIVQTRDGYLWLGTSNGLARFDGARFTVYRSADHPELRDSSIVSLLEDRQGTLWIGTQQGGLTSYAEGRFASIAFSQGLAPEPVLALAEDDTGRLWAGTGTGLSHSDDRRFFQREFLPGSPVYSIRQPQRSPVLFATRKGIRQLRLGRIEPYQPGPAELQTNSFFCVHQELERRLWAGGPAGLLCVENSGAVRLLPAARIGKAAVTALLEAADGQIWFVTSKGGLFQVSSGSDPLEAALVWQFSSPATGLLQDNEGNLWVGTAGGGLYRVKPRQLRWIPFPDPFTEARPSFLFETSEGGIQFLAEDNQLYKVQSGSFAHVERLPLPRGVVVQTVCSREPEELWLGTRNDGLFRITGGSVRQFSERNGVSDSGITALCGSRRGLWIGTRNGGLNLLSPAGVITRFNTPWGFLGAHASVLVEDAAGDLWIGTTGDGLFRLSGDRFSAVPIPDGLTAATVVALYAEADGTVWIGTLSGFSRFKAGRVSSFPGPNRTEEEAIVQLCDDAEGNLWAGSSSGIYRYRKEQLHDYADGKARFLDVVPYGREDGLPAVQCVPGVASRGTGGSAGRPWFAASRGVVLGPGPLQRLNTAPPPVVIEAVLVENEPVPLAPRVRIPPGTANIQFQYTALSLTAPGKVAFRYRLEGLDSEWSEVSANRSARYPRLSPGSYTFRVVARNNDGIWNETGAALALVVAPLWWETYWFRLGLVAVLGSVLAGAYRLQRERRRDIERLRLKIAGDLHDDIGSSLWSITLLSRMLAQHASLKAEDRHDVAEINRIAVQTSNAIRDIIWLINPAFDSMQELVLRLKDSAATLLRGVRFEVHSEGVDLAGKLPQQTRQHLLLLLKEALTNIARHAQATTVDLNITETPEQWQFAVRDDGIGFDPAVTTSGNGLRNLRSRAEHLGGTLQISSSPGNGTRLAFAVPRPRPPWYWRVVRGRRRPKAATS